MTANERRTTSEFLAPGPLSRSVATLVEERDPIAPPSAGSSCLTWPKHGFEGISPVPCAIGGPRLYEATCSFHNLSANESERLVPLLNAKDISRRGLRHLRRAVRV